MCEHFRALWKRTQRFRNLKVRRNRFKGVKRTKKINITTALILVICARLFFSAYFDNFARAQQSSEITAMGAEIIDPMKRIRELKDDNGETEPKNCSEDENIVAVALSQDADSEEDKADRSRYLDLVKGSPISEMVPDIARRDSRVAAFLIAIARKESSWGEHAPHRGGQDCFNYWGYKGSYKLTESGYSCFDSKEQAVAIVGDKIEELIGKKIDTPERMLVWKCGSSCAGHDPAGVRKWVSDVSGIFYKLTS